MAKVLVICGVASKDLNKQNGFGFKSSACATLFYLCFKVAIVSILENLHAWIIIFEGPLGEIYKLNENKLNHSIWRKIEISLKNS